MNAFNGTVLETFWSDKTMCCDVNVMGVKRWNATFSLWMLSIKPLSLIIKPALTGIWQVMLSGLMSGCHSKNISNNVNLTLKVV